MLWHPKQELPNIVYPRHEKKKENRDINGRERGWRASWTEKGLRSVQYSEKLFPVFVLTSSLISVMQRNWSEARKMKALTSKAIYSKQKK